MQILGFLIIQYFLTRFRTLLHFGVKKRRKIFIKGLTNYLYMHHRLLSAVSQPSDGYVGHGNRSYVYTNQLRNFSAEFDEGILNEDDIKKKVRSVIAYHYPYKPRKTEFIKQEKSGAFLTDLFKSFQGGYHKQMSKIIQKIVKTSAHDRLVRDVARGIVKAYKVPSKDWQNEAAAIQDFIVRFIRYTFDTAEQFTWPHRLLLDWYEDHEGADCDCVSILYSSLLTSLGWRKVWVALVDSKGNGVLSHACVAIKMPKDNTKFGKDLINIELTKGDKTEVAPFGWLPDKYTKYILIDVVPQINENPDGEKI